MSLSGDDATTEIFQTQNGEFKPTVFTQLTLYLF
jgi:hypothetical protein